MARRRSRHNDSIIDVALTSTWHVSAFLSGFFLIGVYFLLPMFFNGKLVQPIFLGLRPVALFLALIFGVIAVVKFLKAHSQQTINRESEPRGWQPGPAIEPVVDNDNSHAKASPASLLLSTSNNAKPASWSLEVLQSIEWKRFEEVVAAYFRQKGFDCRTIRCGPDGGVDATIYQNDKKVAVVQCKAWNGRPVGVKPVRELLGVMTHQQVNKGYFMATSSFTKEAEEFAKGQNFILVSGEALLMAIKRMPDENQQALLDVATQGDYTTPSCPSCGIKLVKRQSDRGDFWGCSNYPRCKVKIGMRVEG